MGIVGLGLLDYVYDKTLFVCLAFLFKIMCGIGMGTNATSSFSIIATHYPNDREQCLGAVEAAAAVGVLFGRVIGSILY